MQKHQVRVLATNPRERKDAPVTGTEGVRVRVGDVVSYGASRGSLGHCVDFNCNFG